MQFFDQINMMLIERFGEMGPLYGIGGLGLLLVLIAAPVFLKKEEDTFEKLAGRRVIEPKKKDKKAQKELRTKDKNAQHLNKFSGFLEPQDEEEYSAIRLKLIQAGYGSKSAVPTFYFMQFALGIGLLILGVLFAVVKGNMDMKQMIMAVLIPGAAGYLAPKYWVERRRQMRQEQIAEGFPDSLDLMLVCVEAGQSLDQSIIRVSQEIRAGFPALADEFELVSFEIKAGKDKVQVLKDMGERCGVSDVSSFVTVLIQSAAFGTSIAEALRVYASEMRDKRVMRAEEKANKLPTKLTLGTMMFTVPPLMIILIGPSIYEIVQTLSH
ncbi:MAG: type II secretion system F family protein [Brevirhabdus sp.]